MDEQRTNVRVGELGDPARIPASARVAWRLQELPRAFVDRSGRAAAQWLGEPLPADAHVLVASAGARVLAHFVLRALPHESEHFGSRLGRIDVVASRALGIAADAAWGRPLRAALEATPFDGLWCPLSADAPANAALRRAGFALGHATLVWTARPEDVSAAHWEGTFGDPRSADEDALVAAAERTRAHRYAGQPRFAAEAVARFHAAVARAVLRGTAAERVIVAYTADGEAAGFVALDWRGPASWGLAYYRHLVRRPEFPRAVVPALLAAGAGAAAAAGAQHVTAQTSVGHGGMIEQAQRSGFRVDHVLQDWFWFREAR